MLFLNKTLATIEQNLAMDEWLLQQAEARAHEDEVLRIWEAPQPCVVLGRSSRVEQEVDVEHTTAADIPIVRRMSGGATVVNGPGCLLYSVLLSLEARPHLRMLDEAHGFVMTRIASAVRQLEPAVQLDGTCDLVVEQRKVSGNALRVQRRWLLYHGTLLLDMDLAVIDACLKHPPREPDYRQGRAHHDFVANLGVDASELVTKLRKVWQIRAIWDPIDLSQVLRIAADKYEKDEWTYLR